MKQDNNKRPLSNALIKQYHSDALFKNFKSHLKSASALMPSRETIEADVLKMISKRANLSQIHFAKTDVLTESYLEYTSTRLHALLISLNRYLQNYDQSFITYNDIAKNGTKVSDVITKITAKFYPL